MFVTGEYNWGVQPGLKNLTDHFLEEWFWRPAAVASYSGGRISGARQTLPGMARFPTGIVVISSTLMAGPIEDATPGQAIGFGLDSQQLEDAFPRFADDLAWWTEGRRTLPSPALGRGAGKQPSHAPDMVPASRNDAPAGNRRRNFVPLPGDYELLDAWPPGVPRRRGPDRDGEALCQRRREATSRPARSVFDVGERYAPAWLVLEGSIEVVRRDGLNHEAAITSQAPANSPARSASSPGAHRLVRPRGPQGCTALPFDAAHLRALIIGSAEVGEIVMRAFILRRVGLIEEGGVRLDPGRHPARRTLVRLQGFLTRNGYPYTVLDAIGDAEGRALVERLAYGPTSCR